MIQATKDMFSKYAVFTGRTSRSDFWWAILGYYLLSIAAGFVGGFVGGFISGFVSALAGIEMSYLPSLIVGVWILATIVPVLALEVRRLHDINKSGWWLFISLVPFGYIVLIVFYCLPEVNDGNIY